MCEELFGGKLKVTVAPDCFEKSEARWQKNCLYRTLHIAMQRIFTIEEMVQKMDEFRRIKKTCSCQIERVSLRCCTHWSNFAKIPNTRRAGLNNLGISWERLLVERWNWRGSKVLRASHPGRNSGRKKPNPEAKKPDLSRRACPEAGLIKLAEEVSYAAILKNLKKHVKPDELGVTVHGIRETCSKDLLGKWNVPKKAEGS